MKRLLPDPLMHRWPTDNQHRCAPSIPAASRQHISCYNSELRQQRANCAMRAESHMSKEHKRQLRSCVRRWILYNECRQKRIAVYTVNGCRSRPVFMTEDAPTSGLLFGYRPSRGSLNCMAEERMQPKPASTQQRQPDKKVIPTEKSHRNAVDLSTVGLDLRSADIWRPACIISSARFWNPNTVNSPATW